MISRIRLPVLLIALSAACAVEDADNPVAIEVAPSTAAAVGADWSTPVPITAVNSPASEQAPALSPDGLTLYFTTNRNGNNDIYASTRMCRVCEWSEPAPLPAPINTPMNDAAPFVSADGRLLFLNSNREGNVDLFVSRRLPTGDWDTPVRLGPGANTALGENNAHYLLQPGDGYVNGPGVHGVLYYGRAGVIVAVGLDRDLQVTGGAVPITELNDPALFSAAPTLSASGLELIYHRSQPPDAPAPFFDLMLTTRHTIHDRWSPPVNLGPVVNSDMEDLHPALSLDGRTLVFASSRGASPTEWDLWMTTR